jgi:hypothetical protein
MEITKKSVGLWVLRLVVGVPVIGVAVIHPALAFWLFATASLAWTSYPLIEWVDRKVWGPRWISHLVVYLLWAVYAFVLYRFISPWIYLGVHQAIDAGKDLAGITTILEEVWKEFRLTLEGFAKPETIDKAIHFAQETLSKNGATWGLTALGVGRQVLFGATLLILLMFILPLLVIVLHSKREEEEAGAFYCVSTFCDGDNGSVTRLIVFVWNDYIQGMRGIFRAIFWSMLLFTFLYAILLFVFEQVFGVHIPLAAHGLYSALLGILGAIPLIGGMVNWVTISYVGLTIFGLAKPFVIMFLSQIGMHKLETGVVTPWLMGKEMHVPIGGMVVIYAVALSLFGATATGFAASFLFLPLWKSLLKGLLMWKSGEFEEISTRHASPILVS